MSTEAQEQLREARQNNSEMDLAWQFIEGTNVSVFLTGKAGTGKTTFLRRLRELSPKRMVVVAPTGVAAINAQGVTIHSFFQIAPGVHIPGAAKERPNIHFQISKEKKNILRTMDLLVIDEISMVRADLLDAIDEVLRSHRDRFKPFGGVQLLLIGDLQQLAPVAVDREWELLRNYYTTPYFFGSKALQQTPFVTVELQHIYRQSDSEFIQLLSQIRSGHYDEGTLAALNRRYIPDFTPDDAEAYIRLTTHNHKAQQYNEAKLTALPTRTCTFHGSVSGDFPETSYPADLQLTLKVGAQVMFLKNDPSGQQQYYNGKIGRVAALSEGSATVVCPDSPVPISVGVDEWTNAKVSIDAETKEIKEEIIGTFRQIPLRLAWAITIHKSQGLTFDRAVLDINDSFTHGQVYVALSRCRSLEGIVLTRPVQLRTLTPDESVGRFMQASLEQGADSARQLPTLRADYFRALLDELFAFDGLQRGIAYVDRILQEHLSRLHPSHAQRWRALKTNFEQSFQPVVPRFRQQYEALLQQSAQSGSDALLQERVQKAASYFATALQPVAEGVQEVVSQLLPSVANKAVKKQLGSAVDALQTDVRVKQATLRLTAVHGFSVQSYLKDKAQALLHDYDTTTQAKKPARALKTKTPKEAKEKTQDTTLRLFREGRSTQEIAQERGLTVGTVFGHLKAQVEAGQLQYADIIPQEHLLLVREIVERQGRPAHWKELQQHLPIAVQPEMYVILHLLGYMD